MPSSRNEIRQAAVQLLYARHSSPFGPAKTDDVWDLLLDPKRTALDRARVKVLTHFQQGRSRAVDQLEKSVRAASTSFQLAPNAGTLARKIETYFTDEKKWIDQVGTLLSFMKKDTGDWQNTLHRLLEAPSKFQKVRVEIRGAIDDVTIAPKQHKAIADALIAVENYDERVRKVLHPLNYPDQSDLKHLHAHQGDLKEFRARTQALVDAAEARLPEIDAMVAEKLDNYQLDRVAKVDLAIIRLCVYELVFGNDEVPRPVVINGYLQLTEAFSGQEALRFVNGVVDRFQRADSQPKE